MSDFIFSPIGYINTDRKKKYEAPHQPEKGYELSTTLLTLLPGNNYEQALSDLAGFERIWIIYVFDRNTHWKPKVLVPRGRTKRGVFATRAPYRPNPIGISCVRLLTIDKLNLVLADCDILDGTPVLDIKPYIPDIDSFPEAAGGWTDQLKNNSIFSIIEADEVQSALDNVLHEEPLLRNTIYDILLNDPYPHPYRRIKKTNDNKFVLAVRLWRITYAIANNIITLIDIQQRKTDD